MQSETFYNISDHSRNVSSIPERLYSTIIRVLGSSLKHSRTFQIFYRIFMRYLKKFHNILQHSGMLENILDNL